MNEGAIQELMNKVWEWTDEIRYASKGVQPVAYQEIKDRLEASAASLDEAKKLLVDLLTEIYK